MHAAEHKIRIFLTLVLTVCISVTSFSTFYGASPHDIGGYTEQAVTSGQFSFYSNYSSTYNGTASIGVNSNGIAVIGGASNQPISSISGFDSQYFNGSYLVIGGLQEQGNATFLVNSSSTSAVTSVASVTVSDMDHEPMSVAYNQSQYEIDATGYSMDFSVNSSVADSMLLIVTVGYTQSANGYYTDSNPTVNGNPVLNLPGTDGQSGGTWSSVYFSYYSLNSTGNYAVHAQYSSTNGAIAMEVLVLQPGNQTQTNITSTEDNNYGYVSSTIFPGNLTSYPGNWNESFATYMDQEAYDPVTGNIFIASVEGVYVFSTITNTVIKYIHTGSTSVGAYYFPQTQLVYISNYANGSVDIFSGNGSLMGSIITGGHPLAMVGGPGGMLYVSDYIAYDAFFEINTQTGSVNNYTFGENNSYSTWGVTYDYNNSYVYVTCNPTLINSYTPTMVYVFDPATQQVVKTITMVSHPILTTLIYDTPSQDVVALSELGPGIVFFSSTSSPAWLGTVGLPSESVLPFFSNDSFDPVSGDIYAVMGNDFAEVTGVTSSNVSSLQVTVNWISLPQAGISSIFLAKKNLLYVNTPSPFAEVTVNTSSGASQEHYMQEPVSSVISSDGSTAFATGLYSGITEIQPSPGVDQNSGGSGAIPDVTLNTFLPGSSFTSLAIGDNGTLLYAGYQNHISVINLSSDSIIKTINGNGSIRNLYTSPNGSFVYVLVDNGSNSRIIVLSGTNEIESCADAGVPLSLAFSSAGMVFVSNANYSLTEYYEDLSLDYNWQIGIYSTSIAMDAYNGNLYMADQEASNGSAQSYITVFDTSSLSVRGNVSVPSTPTGIVYDPYNSAVYVLENETNSVIVLNSSLDVASNLSVGILPTSAVYLESIHAILVANQGSGSVSVIVPYAFSPDYWTGYTASSISESGYVSPSVSNSAHSISVIAGASSTSVSVATNVSQFYSASTLTHFSMGIDPLPGTTGIGFGNAASGGVSSIAGALSVSIATINSSFDTPYIVSYKDSLATNTSNEISMELNTTYSGELILAAWAGYSFNVAGLKPVGSESVNGNSLSVFGGTASSTSIGGRQTGYANAASNISYFRAAMPGTYYLNASVQVFGGTVAFYGIVVNASELYPVYLNSSQNRSIPWVVNLDNLTQNSSLKTDVFYLPNGTYDYSLYLPRGYTVGTIKGASPDLAIPSVDILQGSGYSVHNGTLTILGQSSYVSFTISKAKPNNIVYRLAEELQFLWFLPLILTTGILAFIAADRIMLDLRINRRGREK